MFRNMGGDGHFSGGQTPTSPGDPGVSSSPGLEQQESPWINLFSVVSRPALSFLQKYLPGRPQSPVLSDAVVGWVRGDLKHNLVDEGSVFLGQLDHTSPLAAFPRGDGDAAGLPWLTADSLRHMGLHTPAQLDANINQQTQMGYLSTARSFVSHVMLSSASRQEVKHEDWPTEAVGSPVRRNGTWWWWGGGFWGSKDKSSSWLLSNSSWGNEGTMTGQHCLQRPAAGTHDTVAKTTELFVHSSSRESMPGENAGQSHHKEGPADNGDLQSASSESLQRSEGSTLHHRPSISSHLISAGAAIACSEVALLTPDQDNGYSSLEEEHTHICQLYMVKALGEEEPLKGGGAAVKPEPLRDISEEGDSTAATGMEGEEETEDSDIRGLGDEEDEETPAQESSSSAAMVLTTPHCQNKAIAYIMGSPCSEDDDSPSDSDSSEDDDGFDSEGSSELSDSVDEDDEGSGSDNEADSETERLWNSLCQSRDPYNPRNFTARLPANTTAPRTIPTTTSACSTPTSSPNQLPSPLSSSPASPPFTSSSSPSQNHDFWDDSTSASEVDEAENHRLWKSFSASSDPYSPLNFQAPLRTEVSTEPRGKGRGKKGSQTPPRSPYHTPSSPPRYRKEEAEERLDSGFSEPPTSTVAFSTTSTTLGCVTLKKVRFCEEVEEFFASCSEEEDRRGPWEELARDRCRFLRRCQEVEQSIAHCLQPQHRRLVYQRMTGWYNR